MWSEDDEKPSPDPFNVVLVYFLDQVNHIVQLSDRAHRIRVVGIVLGRRQNQIPLSPKSFKEPEVMCDLLDFLGALDRGGPPCVKQHP